MDKQEKRTTTEVKAESIKEVSFAEFERTMKKIVKSNPQKKQLKKE